MDGRDATLRFRAARCDAQPKIPIDEAANSPTIRARDQGCRRRRPASPVMPATIVPSTVISAVSRRELLHLRRQLLGPSDRCRCLLPVGLDLRLRLLRSLGRAYSLLGRTDLGGQDRIHLLSRRDFLPQDCLLDHVGRGTGRWGSGGMRDCPLTGCDRYDQSQTDGCKTLPPHLFSPSRPGIGRPVPSLGI